MYKNGSIYFVTVSDRDKIIKMIHFKIPRNSTVTNVAWQNIIVAQFKIVNGSS